MLTRFRSVIVLLFVVAACTVFAAKSSEPADTGFKLEDFLGRHWQNEAVRFPLSPEQLKSAKARWALVGPDNKPVPYQIVSTTSGYPAIEFLANLNPFETRAYRFTQAAAPAAGNPT